MPDSKAKEPFRFSTRFHLAESTGLRAATVDQLLALVREVPGSCIYHHTHRSLQQHEYLSPEPPNDFAYWVTDELGESELGERLASIDIIRFTSIRGLRERLVETIEEFLSRCPQVRAKTAHAGKEFYFNKSVSFVVQTPYVANDLREFAAGLRTVTLDSIYFHIFEARLRLENTTNDFSNWLEHSMERADLANAVARLDPYTYALDDLRQAVVRIVEPKEAD